MLDMSTMPEKSSARQSFNDEERRGVKAWLTSAAVFLELRHDMPMRYAVSLMAVAEEEGLPLNEYAKRWDVSPSVMSRHLLDIGDRDRNMGEGLGLVYTKADPLELRVKRAFLTDKGKVIVRRVLRAMGR